MNKKRLLGVVTSTICIIVISASCASFGGGDSGNGNGGNGGLLPETTIATAQNQTIGGSDYTTLPFNGIYVQAGKTLTLSWSADGNVEGFILTETQFNQFEQYLILFAYDAHSQGASKTFSWQVLNSDTYYGVVTNRAVTGSTVKLYQAKLTLR